MCGLFGGGNTASIESTINGAIANQSTQTGLRDILLSSANNNYETARLISDQNMTMQNQNNANLINVIQGFNNIMMTMQNQTNQLGSKIDALSAQINSCCCDIKTQMLQYRLDDANAKIVTLENNINNANQSQYLLGQMGKWVANAPSAAA